MKGQTQYHTLVRLNPDGSLDSTFMNFSGPIDTNNFYVVTFPIAPTDDGGYLMGGTFNSYQGYPKPSIAKIDSSGAVEPQYFTSGGPDSSIILGANCPLVEFIYKSKFGGYYVGGDFLKWDGQPSQPLIRLTDLVIGLDENGRPIESKSEVSVYPNPAQNQITIQSNVLLVKAQVFNLQGQLVTTGRANSFSIEGLKSGIYFIKAILKNGEVVSKKLIKQ